ncbi:polyprenol monophosphomannose synthase [Kineococcus sp. SYSU DK006]|uniref:polyprenol monophosphomannose synthase n=1 Tax=Kineococcus sp. SYSU DK006 TaxID=3383127 RepID=UPI003D7CBFE0
MRVLVVLPTYQEAENIERTLDLVLASGVRPDVLVVDDSSPDGTGRLVEAVAARYPGRVELLTRAVKDGLGGAYRAGFRRAVDGPHDVVVQMDADGSHPVDALAPMLAAVRSGADLVLGSRYVRGGGLDDDWPLHRRVLSRGGNLYAAALLRLGVRDLTGGFKMWRADLLRSLPVELLDATGYAFQIQTTLAAQRHGAAIVEVPIHFAERQYGESKMSSTIVREAMVAVTRMAIEGPESGRRRRGRAVVVDMPRQEEGRAVADAGSAGGGASQERTGDVVHP